MSNIPSNNDGKYKRFRPCICQTLYHGASTYIGTYEYCSVRCSQLHKLLNDTLSRICGIKL